MFSSFAASASCNALRFALTFFNASLLANLTLDLMLRNVLTSLDSKNTGLATRALSHLVKSFCLLKATSGELDPHIAFPGNGGNSPASKGYIASSCSCNA